MQDPIAKLAGSWLEDVTIYSVIIRVLIALIIGALMGYERARRGHAAGLRTYIMISLGTTVIAICEAAAYSTAHILSAASLIGIALIGTNSITISSKNRIKGLTTTVGLFIVAILGVATGMGCYTISIVGAILALICMAFLGGLEVELKQKSSHMLLHLELTKSSYLVNFTTTIRKLGMRISELEIHKAYLNTSLAVYTVSIELNNKNVLMYKKHKDIVEALMSLEYVVYAEEIM